MVETGPSCAVGAIRQTYRKSLQVPWATNAHHLLIFRPRPRAAQLELQPSHSSGRRPRTRATKQSPPRRKAKRPSFTLSPFQVSVSGWPRHAFRKWIRPHTAMQSHAEPRERACHAPPAVFAHPAAPPRQMPRQRRLTWGLHALRHTIRVDLGSSKNPMEPQPNKDIYVYHCIQYAN